MKAGVLLTRACVRDAAAVILCVDICQISRYKGHFCLFLMGGRVQ